MRSHAAICSGDQSARSLASTTRRRRGYRTKRRAFGRRQSSRHFNPAAVQFNERQTVRSVLPGTGFHASGIRATDAEAVAKSDTDFNSDTLTENDA